VQVWQLALDKIGWTRLLARIRNRGASGTPRVAPAKPKFGHQALTVQRATAIPSR